MTEEEADLIEPLLRPGVDRLGMWVLYDHPLDFPNLYVARYHHIEPGRSVPGPAFGNVNLTVLRAILADAGRVKLMRSNDDDPAILETWI